MGFISAGITVMIGYFAIEFLKKNKEKLKDMPIVADFIDLDNMDSVSYDAYFIVLFCAQGFYILVIYFH